jgi:exodeoxyribonuclease VII large subunit
VVTSLAAAALRDVLTTLKRRNCGIPVIVYPAPVQGDGAADRLATMIARANRRAECDVLLLVRGGGSIEDLWSFNEERLARAIRASNIPVVVGVGHESDFTIADFAADRRAPTPTAAAELATPSSHEMLARVAGCAGNLSREMRRRLQYAMQALDGTTRRLVHPAERVRNCLQTLAHLRTRLAFAFGHRVHRSSARLDRLQVSLAGLDPAAVLRRGYSITENADGKVLRDASQARSDETITTRLARGSLRSVVKKTDLL